MLEHTSHQQAQLKLRRRYEYSQAGNLTKIEDAQRGQTEYEYDPLDRLTAVRGVINETFMHDPAGNLLLDRKANVEGNKLLFQGDKHYQYDEFGNLVRESRGHGGKLVTNYEYDAQHRLIKVTKPDGTVATYQYDAFGRRIEKSVTDKIGQNKTTEFLWQGNKLLAESSQESYQTYLYEYGSFRPLALITGEGAEQAQAYFYHLDQVGTPLEITDVEGSIAWAVDYQAYGNVARERVRVVNSPLRFQGQYFDEETGLHYNRHRYYSPETGRFITVDPIGLAGGLNNYQYVKNPTGWVDPLGLEQNEGIYPKHSAAKISSDPSLNELDKIFAHQIGDIISENPVANASYARLQKQGTDVILVNDPDMPEMGFFNGNYNTITINTARHTSANEIVSTIVHEATHQKRFFNGKALGTQYEEYLAFRNEFLFKNLKRPTLKQRKAIWKDIQELYDDLATGKNPFGGSNN